MRIWHAMAGLFMLVPLGAFESARVINVIGVCLAVALLVSNRLATRRATAA